MEEQTETTASAIEINVMRMDGETADLAFPVGTSFMTVQASIHELWGIPVDEQWMVCGGVPVDESSLIDNVAEIGKTTALFVVRTSKEFQGFDTSAFWKKLLCYESEAADFLLTAIDKNALALVDKTSKFSQDTWMETYTEWVGSGDEGGPVTRTQGADTYSITEGGSKVKFAFDGNDLRWHVGKNLLQVGDSLLEAAEKLANAAANLVWESQPLRIHAKFDPRIEAKYAQVAEAMQAAGFQKRAEGEAGTGEALSAKREISGVAGAPWWFEETYGRK